MIRMEGKNITVGYDGVEIIKNLDVAIPEGKITAIIGPNGCGKSTLLKGMSRLLPLQTGSILLDGKSIEKMKGREIAHVLSILPQSPVAPADLTVEELVSYGRYPHQKGFGRLKSKDREKIQWALEITNLVSLKDRGLETLSGGQRQKVWIAMALAQDTEIILLDEPTTYLDLVHQLEVLQLLERLNRETDKTIVLVIHELNMAARFSHHMIAVKEGRIQAQGTPEQIMTPAVLAEVFHIDAVIVKDPTDHKPVCITYNIKS